MLPICGDGEKGVTILFGDRYLDRLIVKVEKNENIPDVRGCYSLLSYQRRAEKKLELWEKPVQKIYN